MFIATRRARILTVVLAAATLSISLSACNWGPGGPSGPGTVLTEKDDATDDPNNPNIVTRLSSFLPSADPNEPIVTPDPIEMSVDVPVTLFTNTNPDGVTPGATVPATFTVTTPIHALVVATYHYVLPSGVPTTGQVSLQGPDGKTYGPWPTTGSDGQGGIVNAVWSAEVDLTLSAGTYTVIDSDPATWSANKGTGGAGMFWINGDALTP